LEGILAIFSRSFCMWEILEREGSESRDFWEILLCEDLQRMELEEEVVQRAWDEFVSDYEVQEVEETSSPLIFLQSFIFLFVVKEVSQLWRVKSSVGSSL